MRLETSTSRSRLVIASYNIHGCIGTDRKHDTLRIAEVLREIDADILGLQELHAHGVGPDPIDEVQFLAAVSGFEVVTGTTFVGPRGAYGIALLSRLPIRAVRRIDLHVPPREPRCARDVDVAVDCDVIRVITTHLGLALWERRIQVQRLTDSIVRDPSRIGAPRLMGMLRPPVAPSTGLLDAQNHEHKEHAERHRRYDKNIQRRPR